MTLTKPWALSICRTFAWFRNSGWRRTSSGPRPTNGRVKTAPTKWPAVCIILWKQPKKWAFAWRKKIWRNAGKAWFIFPAFWNGLSGLTVSALRLIWKSNITSYHQATKRLWPEPKSASISKIFLPVLMPSALTALRFGRHGSSITASKPNISPKSTKVWAKTMTLQ